MRLSEVKTGVLCSGAVVRAPTSMSATGSPHTVAAEMASRMDSFLNRIPYLRTIPSLVRRESFSGS